MFEVFFLLNGTDAPTVLPVVLPFATSQSITGSDAISGAGIKGLLPKPKSY